MKTDVGIVPRIIAFVSKAGLPDDLEKAFDTLGVQIYEAEPGSGRAGKGHAEGAAAAFRKSVETQVEDLGGEVTEVDDLYSSNRFCSEDCAEDATDFLDNGVKLSPKSFGWVEGQELTPDAMKQLRADTGPGRAINVVSRMYLAGAASEDEEE